MMVREFVSWDDEIPNINGNIIKPCSSHHQPQIWIPQTFRIASIQGLPSRGFPFSALKKMAKWMYCVTQYTVYIIYILYTYILYTHALCNLPHILCKYYLL